MAQYRSESIKNAALLGHSGDGKTALAEAMLYLAGAVDRVGGNLDFDPEEKRRGSSVSASLAAFEWKGKKINLLDTPGYFDFAGEVKQALRAADTAVLVVDGKSGLKVGTELAWDYAEGMARCFFVNKTDDENARFDEVLGGLKEKFGSSVCPVFVPCEGSGKAKTYCNLITGEAFTYDGKGGASKVSVDMSQFEDKIAELTEVLAETDEALMEKFFEEEPFTREEMEGALHKGLCDGSVCPVFSGAATCFAGVAAFLDTIAGSFMSAAERDSYCGKELVPEGETSLFCFKTVADTFGKKSFFRVMSGVLKKDSVLRNLRSEQNEKIVRLYTCIGAKEAELEEAPFGDIAYTTKLSATATGDTLGGKEAFPPIDYPKPYYRMAIVPRSKGDEDKLSTGIARLLEEDPTLKYENNPETKQMLISGLGDMHLDVVAAKLKNRYGVSADYAEPKTAYRETIKKTIQTDGKHKKQSGGAGQYGHVKITFSHGEDEGLTFTQSVVGGNVPKNYYPAVEKGLLEAMQKGVLAGFPVVHLAADLFDGSYHPVDSNDISFKLAAILAYKQTINANPVILEPIGFLRVLIPTSYSGDIMGDISKRRGRIMGMAESSRKGYTVIEAEIPSAEMNSYAIQLRAMTQGRGSYTFEYVRYEEAPADVAAKIIEQAKKAEE